MAILRYAALGTGSALLVPMVNLALHHFGVAKSSTASAKVRAEMPPLPVGR